MPKNTKVHTYRAADTSAGNLICHATESLPFLRSQVSSNLQLIYSTPCTRGATIHSKTKKKIKKRNAMGVR